MQKPYRLIAACYDILDYPWERLYRHWRAKILADVHGQVLEVGVGTGRNLPYYSADVKLVGIDLSMAMLNYAQQRARRARAHIDLCQLDAANMNSIQANCFDWIISTFMCCVLPDVLQQQTLNHFTRVLKPGGQFKLLEIVYSKNPRKRAKQKRIAWLVEKLYGARFDRQTLTLIEHMPEFNIIQTTYLKDDTYLLIHGQYLPIRAC